MKNLQIVCERAEVVLRTTHYQSFLNTPEYQRMLEAALQKSQGHQLSLLQYLVLKMMVAMSAMDLFMGRNGLAKCGSRLYCTTDR